MTDYAVSTGEDGKSLSVDILVMPGSSMMTLACAGDPMRAANRLVGRKVFDWRYVSLDGRNPLTSNGSEWSVAGKFDPGRRRDIFVVVSGFRSAEMQDRRVISRIFQAAKNATSTIGVESGAWLLARAGLLDGRNATTHWEDFEEFATSFALVHLRPDRYVTDGRYVTTSGASPTFDMMIDLVGQHVGLATALDVAGVFVYEAARSAGDVQSIVSFGPANTHDPRVVKAIRVMEMCIDAPVPIAAIAKRVSLSPRGLEQLFVRQIGQTPGAYFLVLRLNAARKLVMDTSLRMTDIALRTGFSSEAAFSRAFKREFGAAPMHYRADPPNR